MSVSEEWLVLSYSPCSVCGDVTTAACRLAQAAALLSSVLWVIGSNLNRDTNNPA
jgi:hypothetical protein